MPVLDPTFPEYPEGSGCHNIHFGRTPPCVLGPHDGKTACAVLGMTSKWRSSGIPQSICKLHQ